MNILLLGGTRFIGRHVAEALEEVGEVTLLNRGLSRPGAERPRGRIIVADRSRPDAMACLGAERFDAIVDISAEDSAFIENTLPYINGRPHYVYLSSASVYLYGSSEALALVEDDPAGGDPVWGEYGQLKYKGEQRLRASGLPVTILRAPYVYGPYNNCAREDFIWARLIHRKPIFMPRNGGSRLQFCFVTDLADLIANVVGQPPLQSEPRVLNVAEARHYSMTEYVELLAEIAGERSDIRPVHSELPARAYFPFRDVSFALATTSLASACPLWRGTDLTGGLATTFQWFNAPRRRDKALAYAPTEGERQLLAAGG